ncbi:hypothetical protein SAMN04487907_101541 [Zunongwangia mangrovi]|uniref:ABC-2 type transport system permease protein n=1 Tax=Zunongwangia mangrovi TaxID=1334022 RepID=A0A1I1DPK9_9FLAO|nr:DUF5687 family protein [Zunongwangia mangrovi]SFB76895.1 hypothetical protein SAMN04487907_101541 [Zunongwangia mangrovi]
MVGKLLSLEWKSFTRSASFGKSLGLKIFMIFLAVYFAVVFLFMGIGLYPILKKIYPDNVPLLKLNEFILGWLAFELIFRFFMQSLPVVQIKPLLLQNIRKSKVINFVLLKSLFSFYNILPLLIYVPFAVVVAVKTDYTAVSMIGWSISVLFLSFSINFFNFLIKKKFAEDLKSFLPAIIVILTLAGLEYFNIVPVSEKFGIFLNYVLEMPYLAIVPIILCFLFFVWVKNTLKRKFYLDAGLKTKQKEVKSQDFEWLKRFGEVSTFLQLDMKLIWRNKRPKTTIFLSVFFLLYGLLFFTNSVYEGMPVMYVFAGIFISGIFMINFGQFVPSWDAAYYQMIMSQNIPMRKYLASKAALISFSIIILTILSTPYVYFGWNILLIIFTCALYNLGVNVPLLMFTGSFNKKRIDLEKSPFMNYQGTGAAQWLVAIPLLAVPLGIFYLFYKLFSFNIGLLVIGILGVIGILLRNYLMDRITIQYKKNKYAMIHGYKQTGD